MEKLVQWVVQRSRGAQGQGQDWSPIFLTPNPSFFPRSNGAPGDMSSFFFTVSYPVKFELSFGSTFRNNISHPSTASTSPEIKEKIKRIWRPLFRDCKFPLKY